MDSVIKSGYRFTTTSYENDGDNSKTVVLDGVPENKAKLLGRLSALLISNETGLENNYEPSKKEFEKAHKIMLPIFEEYKDVFTNEKFALIQDDVGEMQDFIAENLLGYPGEEGYALRSLTSIKVEYIPMDIVVPDVTADLVK